MTRTIAALPFLLLIFALTPVRAQTECAAPFTAYLETVTNLCEALSAGSICTPDPQARVLIDGSTPPEDSPLVRPFTEIQSLQTTPTTDGSSWSLAVVGLSTADPTISAYLLLAGESQLTRLPETESATLALHLRTSFEEVPCAAAPSAALLYVPTGAVLEMTLNTARLTVNEGISLLYQQSRNNLTAAVFKGTLSLADGPSAGELQTLVAVTDNDGEVAFWSQPRTITPEEITQGEALAAAFTSLTGLEVALGCTPRTHLVQAGDTAFRISQMYGVSLEALTQANNLTGDYILVIGQELQIPCTPEPPVTVQVETQDCDSEPVHTVVSGETLSGIALRYGVTVEEIAAANAIANVRLIFPNQSLTIPFGVDSGFTPGRVAPSGLVPGPALPTRPIVINPGLTTDFCTVNVTSLLATIPPELQAVLNSVCNP